MKRFLKFFVLLFALSATIVSCEKDDEPSTSSNENSSLSNNVLSGKIDLFTNGSTNGVKALLYQNEDTTRMGYSAITSDGSFSFTLSTPTTSDLENFAQHNLSESFTGTVSDANALTSQSTLGFWTYLNGSFSGDMIKTNFSILNNRHKKGSSWSIFIYCDREVTVSGKKTNMYDEGTTYSTTLTANYNFTIKKGWNELVTKVINFSESSTGSDVEEISLSNTITSDLKWRLFSDNLRSASIESNTQHMNPFGGFMKR